MTHDPETGDRIVPWDELPADVRARIGAALPPGHVVWACLRRVRGGLFRRDVVHTEYWWEDGQGELIEAFWFED